VSYGRGDAALVELKLASNSKLERNLEHQVEIYKEANRTDKAIKLIVFYTADEERKLQKILTRLGQVNAENVVLVDARADNKPSASTASSH
jgi:hypothetical protein